MDEIACTNDTLGWQASKIRHHSAGQNIFFTFYPIGHKFCTIIDCLITHRYISMVFILQIFGFLVGKLRHQIAAKIEMTSLSRQKSKICKTKTSIHVYLCNEAIYYDTKFEANWIKSEKVILSCAVVADFGCLLFRCGTLAILSLACASFKSKENQLKSITVEDRT